MQGFQELNQDIFPLTLFGQKAIRLGEPPTNIQCPHKKKKREAIW